MLPAAESHANVAAVLPVACFESQHYYAYCQQGQESVKHHRVDMAGDAAERSYRINFSLIG
jgi:hypothetical protein